MKRLRMNRKFWGKSQWRFVSLRETVRGCILLTNDMRPVTQQRKVDVLLGLSTPDFIVSKRLLRGLYISQIN